MDEETIGSRAKRVREAINLPQKAMADRLGMSLRSWQGMEADTNVPSGETLLKFAAIGINPGWVLSGLGPQKIADEELSQRLMKSLYRIVERAHKDAKIRISGEAEIEETTAMLNRLKALVRDVDNSKVVDAVLPILEQELRERLASAVAQPGSGKHSA